MSTQVEFRYDTDGGKYDVGGREREDEIVARTKCPFCNVRTAFRQIYRSQKSEKEGDMVALSCDSCQGIVSCNIGESVIHPQPSVEGLEDGLPEDIEKYYNEGLRCLEANAPNGAATVFRKVIDAVCIYYDVSDVQEDDSFYEMIEKLEEDGRITESLRQSLLGVKDGGRDGAHINNQDPTMDQANNIKQMIDSVLTATVVADQKVEEFREEHPNPYKKDLDSN